MCARACSARSLSGTVHCLAKLLRAGASLPFVLAGWEICLVFRNVAVTMCGQGGAFACVVALVMGLGSFTIFSVWQ